MSIGFVIVTYNSEAVLHACLSSIPRRYPLVVVDNASEDASVAVARSFGATVICNRTNVGFGAACNQGSRLLTTSHVMFFNPDAVLLDNALSELEACMLAAPYAAAFGPASEHEIDGAGIRVTSTIQTRFGPHTRKALPGRGYYEVDFLEGVALLCNRATFDKVGGFDENIFMYCEDDDLSFRLRCADEKLIYVPTSRISHGRKSSSGSRTSLHYWRAWHQARSELYLAQKYNLPLDGRTKQRRAMIRFIRSVATLKYKKAIRYYGILAAFKMDRKSASHQTAFPHQISGTHHRTNSLPISFRHCEGLKDHI